MTFFKLCLVGFIWLVGLCIGSFLNVLIYRLPRGISVKRGRSFCPNCRKKISWYDNIPLLSFAMLGGRCRFCRSPISFRYPLVELITGLLTLLIFNSKFLISNQFLIFNFKTVADLVLTLLLVWGLIVIFFIDLEHQVIPDEILLPIILLFLVKQILYSLFFIHNSLLIILLPPLLSFVFMFSIYLITKGKGMGFGDVKLAFLMGLVLGYPKIIVAFYLAFLTGAFLGLILVVVKKVKFGQKIPFGPFLVWGTTASILWGEEILNIARKILF